MEEDKSLQNRIKLLYLLMFIFTGAFVFFISFITGKSQEAILRNTIVSLLFSGVVIFMLIDAYTRGIEGFLYDNYYRRNRFLVVYFLMVVLSGLFSFVPNAFWPYMSLMVILGLFSNTEIGLTSGIGFVMISVMLEENGSYGEMFMYVLAGCIALALFRDLKEDTAIGIPVFIALLMQGVLLIAFYVLFLNRTFSFKILILPLLNLMFNLIILLVFLNIFGVYIIRRSNDMYMVINDSEYPLLAELKSQNKDEYFRAIHTGYLAERIALGLGFNDRAVKTCSYYHRIGVLYGKQKWEEVEHYYVDNHFPLEAVMFLHEYIEPKKGEIKSKEALTVLLSETVVASIMYLVKNDKDVKIDYDKLIDDLFDKKEKEGKLIEYDITFREYDQMRKILKKEKLYYDFLR